MIRYKASTLQVQAQLSCQQVLQNILQLSNKLLVQYQLHY